MAKLHRLKKQRYLSAVSILIVTLLAFLILCPDAGAKPVSKGQARSAVRGWLKGDNKPLDTELGNKILSVDTHKDDKGQTIYYVVYLKPNGFVIVSAEDSLEPIIAFSQGSTFDPSEANPLGSLVTKDTAGRMDYLKSNRYSTPAIEKAKGKWNTLQSAAEQAGPEKVSTSSVSDVRVSPLTLSKWNQEKEGSNNCYNYYTPNNYPTGCVATMMAQLMRYHQHPTSGIGANLYQITVNGSSQYLMTRGGNGSGGPYLWSQMPLDPDSNTNLTQRQAIGALCFDAGLSVNMSYTSASSSSSPYDATLALVNVFGYSNSVFGQNSLNNMGAGLNAMVNPNLDASLPVGLSITGPVGGHAVIADGYGYSGSTLYHHINIGWGGIDNVWYTLPTIDASYLFTSIDGCTYNLYVTGTGEIISGRVIDLAGNPISGVTVEAKIGSSVIKQTTTGTNGIYALTNLSSNQSYTIQAIAASHAFVPQNTSTGNSSNWQSTSGNVWGINFVSSSATPPTAYNMTADMFSGAPDTITLQASDEGYPDPPAAMKFIITSLPSYGKLTDLSTGEITTVPHTLANGVNSVQYRSCAAFAGQDTFDFVANDFGNAPQGGNSNTATVTIDVDNHIYTTYEPQTNWIAYWPLVTSYHDSRSQVIYLKSDIGQAKTITDLALDISNSPGQTMNNFTIRMKHTTLTKYVGFPEFEANGWTIVYQGNEAATPTGWRNFSFQTPFAYNGINNLMIDFSFNNSFYTTDGDCHVSDTGENRLVFAYSDSQHGDPLNWDYWTFDSVYPSSAIPNIKLISQISVDQLDGDFNRNCTVDIPDMAILSAAWSTSLGHADYNENCDISSANDDTINLADLIVFMENWLQTSY